MSHQEKNLAIMVAYESYEDEDGIYFIFDNETLSAHRLKLREHQCDLFFCGNLMILGVGEEPYAFDLRDIVRAEKIEHLYHQGGIIRFAFKNDKSQIVPVMSIRQNQMITGADKNTSSLFDTNQKNIRIEIANEKEISEPATLSTETVSQHNSDVSIKIANETFEKKEVEVLSSAASSARKKSPLMSHTYRYEKPTTHFEFELFELDNKGLLFEVYQYENRDIVNPDQPLKMAFKQDFLRIETQEKYFLFNLSGFENFNVKKLIDEGRSLTIHFIKDNHIDQEFFFKTNNHNPIIPTPPQAPVDKNASLNPISLTVPLVSSAEKKDDRQFRKNDANKNAGSHFYTIRYGSKKPER